VFLVIAGYTLVVVANHGLHLLAVFFGDMTRMQRPGQFNLDLMCLLLLAGLWASWRHQFSVAGVVLGLVAVFGGAGCSDTCTGRRRRIRHTLASRSDDGFTCSGVLSDEDAAR
jgi:hypothetical protein